jgi:hypothetical protein
MTYSDLLIYLTVSMIFGIFIGINFSSLYRKIIRSSWFYLFTKKQLVKYQPKKH